MNTRSLGGAYQGAVEATLALVISVLAGVWADSRFDTSPTFLLAGLAVGFGAFILRLTRLLRGLAGPDDDESDGSALPVPSDELRSSDASSPDSEGRDDQDH